MHIYYFSETKHSLVRKVFIGFCIKTPDMYAVNTVTASFFCQSYQSSMLRSALNIQDIIIFAHSTFSPHGVILCTMRSSVLEKFKNLQKYVAQCLYGTRTQKKIICTRECIRSWQHMWEKGSKKCLVTSGKLCSVFTSRDLCSHMLYKCPPLSRQLSQLTFTAALFN